MLPWRADGEAEFGEIAFLRGVVQGQRVMLNGVELSQVRTTVQEHATHDFGKDRDTLGLRESGHSRPVTELP